MKQPYKLLMSLFFLNLLFFISCDKLPTNSFNRGEDYPPDVLPEETHTGENRFGCLLNGKIFANSKRVKIGLGDYRIRAYYSTFPANTFTIYAYAHNETRISLVVEVDSLIGNDTISIIRAFYSTLFKEDDIYRGYLDKEYGKLYLTNYDTINHIISGRFEFIAHSVDTHYNPYGDSIIHVTEGRFDIEYEPSPYRN